MYQSGYVYFVKSNAIPGLYKIGETRNCKVRMAHLKVKYPDLDLRMIVSAYTKNRDELEWFFQSVYFLDQLPTVGRHFRDWYLLTDAQANSVKRILQFKSNYGKDILDYLDTRSASFYRNVFQRQFPCHPNKLPIDYKLHFIIGE